MSESRFPTLPKRAAALGASAVVLALTGVVSWHGIKGEAADPNALVVQGRRPNIILITIDALRADHLGIYGYDRPTSPHLDALAREAAVVGDDISQAPFTKASIASLFTGLYPSTHKTYTTSRSFGQTMTGHVSGRLPFTDVLDSSLWRLPEALQTAGYQTIGIDTNPFLIPEFGYAQGFQQYEFITAGDQLASAGQVTARALARIDGRNAKRPLFLWFHLMEPHSPYTPTAAYRTMFPPLTPPLSVPAETFPPWIVVDGSTDVHFYEALYDAEIREADDALGSFFDALKQRGLWNDAVLVITADHGEEFYDHGGFEHSRTLYDEMLHVPLFFKAPGLRGGMRNLQTQEVDIAPTLVTLAGGSVPSGLAGENIWDELSGRRGSDDVAFAERPDALFALRTPEWKFISDLQAHHELYHLTDDPHERRNLAPEKPDLTAAMRDRLIRFVGSAVRAGEHVKGDYAAIPPRVLKRLQSLGYIK
jgi:arylsulfatase A-like enzyme